MHAAGLKTEVTLDHARLHRVLQLADQHEQGLTAIAAAQVHGKKEKKRKKKKKEREIYPAFLPSVVFLALSSFL